MTKKIVFLGCGNMGEALLAGLMKSKRWTASSIMVTDKRVEQLVRLRKKYHVRVSDDNREAVKNAATVLLAVKPQQMEEVLQKIAPVLKGRTLVLSIAAGIPTSRIEAALPLKTAVVRIMPNTPALVSMGAAAIAAGRWATRAHLKRAETIFQTVGIVVRVPETAMDAVTAVSGSGPAYVFYVAEAMKDAALALGLPVGIADPLVRQTILGAGRLLSSSREEPEDLRRRVTSPGGTTQAALDILEQGQLKSLFFKAIKQAAQRSLELSGEGHKT